MRVTILGPNGFVRKNTSLKITFSFSLKWREIHYFTREPKLERKNQTIHQESIYHENGEDLDTKVANGWARLIQTYPLEEKKVKILTYLRLWLPLLLCFKPYWDKGTGKSKFDKIHNFRYMRSKAIWLYLCSWSIMIDLLMKFITITPIFIMNR